MGEAELSASVCCTDSSLLTLAELSAGCLLSLTGFYLKQGAEAKQGTQQQGSRAIKQASMSSKSSWSGCMVEVHQLTCDKRASMVRVLSGGQGRRGQQQGSWWL